MIHHEIKESIAILRMEHGKVNAMDTEFMAGMSKELSDLESAPISAVIITGMGKVFSAGVDLFRVLDGGRNYLEVFLPALTETFVKLFTFPKPVVAAVNGHALAGGCILVCACDYRIMADGSGTIGVPELHVGVPFPTIAIEIMRFVLPNNYLQEIAFAGKNYSVREALQHGLIDEITDAGTLQDRALDFTKTLLNIPSGMFGLAKRQLRQVVMDRFERNRGPFDKEVMEGWASPEIQAKIRQYLQATIGKKK